MAEVQPLFPSGPGAKAIEKVLIPHCTYGSKLNGAKCRDSSARLPTPLGTCHTINAGGEFGRVKRIGSKWGLELVVDMQYHEKHPGRHKEEDTSYVEVSVCGYIKLR